MNQIEPAIGAKAGRAIYKLAFEQVANQTATMRAICYGNASDSAYIADIAEAADYQALRNYLQQECGIDGAHIDRRFEECLITTADSYEKRFLDADAWNEEQRKTAGLMMQIEFGGVIYSVIKEAAYRVVNTNPEEDKTVPADWKVVAQRAGVADPDDALLWEEYRNTQMEASLYISQEIQKDVLKALMPGSFE
jgi:hypothetical protein